MKIKNKEGCKCEKRNGEVLKRFLVILVAIIVSVGMFSDTTSAANNSHEARIRSAKAKKWEKAYAKFILDKGWEGFSLIKMDKTKVPVLMLCKPDYKDYATVSTYYLYKYKKGKVRKVGKHKQTMADMDVYRNNKKIIFNEYVCSSQTYVCTLKKGKIKKTKYRAEARQERPYGTNYYKGSKRISKKKYDKATKKKQDIITYASDWFTIQGVLLHQKSDQ